MLTFTYENEKTHILFASASVMEQDYDYQLQRFNPEKNYFFELLLLLLIPIQTPEW